MRPIRYKDMTYEQRREYHNAKKRAAYQMKKLNEWAKDIGEDKIIPDNHNPRKWRGFELDTVRRLEKEQPMIIQLRLPRLRAEFKRIPILKRPPYDEYLKARANEILTQHQQPS